MAEKLFDLGSNGVTRSHAYEEDGQIILVETQAGDDLDAIVAANKADADAARNKLLARGSQGGFGARVPIVRWHMWRTEWKNGPKRWGQSWQTFLKSKLNSAEFKHLRFVKL